MTTPEDDRDVADDTPAPARDHARELDAIDELINDPDLNPTSTGGNRPNGFDDAEEWELGPSPAGPTDASAYPGSTSDPDVLRTMLRSAPTGSGATVSPRPRSSGRTSFFYDYDATSGQYVPSRSRFAVAAVAVLAAVFFGFWVVKANSGPAGQSDAAKQAKAAPDAQKGAVVKGSNLPPRSPVYRGSGLDPQEDEHEETPPPPPEPVVMPETAPAAPAPRAPDSWRSSLSVRVTREEEGDAGDDADTDESALGVTLVEGTEIEAVLEGKIDAPDTGLQPELNRVKAVLTADYRLDGNIVFPAGTEFLGRVQQTADKKVHVVFHRVILPDRTSAPCKAIALDSDLSAGVRADKIEKYRKQNVFGRVGRGVVDAAANVATIGHSGAGTIGAGAAEGAADQAREEADGVRRPKKLYHVAAGRQVLIQLSADLSL